MTRAPVRAVLTLFAMAAASAGALPVHAGGAADEGLLSPPVLTGDMAVTPEGRRHLGTVRLFSNDWYGDITGDRFDRWRTGAAQIGVLHGEDWDGALPGRPFELLEYRLRAEVIAPDNLASPAPGDRLYAGSRWLGAQTYFGWQGFEVAAGADLVVTGPQTRLMEVHSAIHEGFGNAPVELGAYEIDNGFYLNANAEIGRDIALGFGSLRPFVEVQAGVETLARVGVDVTLGTLGQGGLRVRDLVTGHRVAGINSDEVTGGWSVVLGADAAWVGGSVFLPEDDGPDPTDSRYRLRAGANYGVGDSNLFYGVSYLSEEFEGQPEGQVVGLLSVDIRF